MPEEIGASIFNAGHFPKKKEVKSFFPPPPQNTTAFRAGNELRQLDGAVVVVVPYPTKELLQANET